MWNNIVNGFLGFFSNLPEIWAQLLVKIGPSLEVMWKGMLGIFVVMAAIAVIVYLLTRIIKQK